MTTQEVYLEATKRGLRLRSAGDKLAVIPKGKCPPDFVAVLRQHKRELLDLIDTRTSQLAPDQAAWLPVARQILCGEFEDCDGSTRDSLNIGLRSIRHPTCEAALRRLWPNGLPKHLPAR